MSSVRWLRALWRTRYGDRMTPRQLLLIALFAGIALVLAGAAWGIPAAADGPVPGGSVAITWLGFGVIAAASIGLGVVKKR